MNNLDYEHIPIPITTDHDVIFKKSKDKIDSICTSNCSMDGENQNIGSQRSNCSMDGENQRNGSNLYPVCSVQVFLLEVMTLTKCASHRTCLCVFVYVSRDEPRDYSQKPCKLLCRITG